MSFLIDTDICSAFLKDRTVVFNRFLQYSGHLQISAVTLGELFTWVFRANAPPTRLQGLLSMLSDMTVLPVDASIARRFGEIRAAQLDRGHVSPPADMWIAATAMEHDLTLVTHNLADFVGVPGLSVTDWLAPP